ncbi:Hsp20/alpha crystallin family protein [Halostella litorea]|uniref:Hsp20/alpha crystallin family protein n=1 Tax=Halostella litorea TaxID=2528831 RepID=UPI00109232B0|nr:Hsp20/alpha crystallin family protein [Halostella litorea]
MNVSQLADGDERVVREYRYDDGVVIAADLGPAASDADVDVLADTAIVVTGSDETAEQIEIDLPGEDAQVFMKNGVLTIELEEEA